MRVADWFEERLQLKKLLGPSMTHPVPRSSASWWYVFGSATLIIFMLQIVTGICLALVYVPSTADVYASLEYLNYQQTLGWFLRAVHFWGSNFMVAMMSLHMIQVFLFGAYKYPRELTWVVGVFLLLCTLGMAFTGQVLRWDQDAYWGLGIGVAMIGRAPLIGAQLVHLVTGGPIIGGETLSRFFALHVFVIPGLLFGLIGVHLLLVLRLGINEWPMPGRLVDRTTYRDALRGGGQAGRRSVLSGGRPEGHRLRRPRHPGHPRCAPRCSGPMAPTARPIPPSSGRCPGPTSTSCRSSPSSPSCRPIPRRF